MSIVKSIFLAIHIISAGIWIAQGAVELLFIPVLRRAKGKPSELSILGAQMQVVGAMGRIGGLGILITGFALLGMDRFGILGITSYTPTWLIIKQIVYIVAMGVVGALITPAARKIEAKFMEAMQGASSVTPEIEQMSKQLISYSRIINLLVLINIFLAVWKPS
jgi:hypothetical protein